MNYIENIFICLASPLVVAVMCTRGTRRRASLFLLVGMIICLLSSYVSTFFASIYGLDLTKASVEISPNVEEWMKLVPILFYILVFEPKKIEVAGGIQMIAAGFATFENVCYLMQNGAEHTLHILVRGFGTGAMHIVCGAIVATGMTYLWDRIWLRIAGVIGVMCLAITYHGIYNMLVLQKGAPAAIGYMIPVLTTVLHMLFGKGIFRNVSLKQGEL